MEPARDARGVARQRGMEGERGGGAGLNGGRRRAAWAALDEQNVDELGSNSAEEGEEEPRRWDELAMGHSILCVASFRPI